MEIKIIIQGKQGSDKVSLAALVSSVFAVAGVSADIYTTNEDIDTSNMEKV